MRRRTRAIFVVVGIAGALATSMLLYVALSDLGEWRNTVARLASDALGRRLAIAGDLSIDLGTVTRVTVTGISLAGPDWGSEPEMASAERLVAEIDLWSLMRGPLRLRSVEIEGGRAISETGPDGRSNWSLGRGGDRKTEAAPFGLRIDRVRATGLVLRFARSAGEPALDLVVSTLTSNGDPEGMQLLELAGGLGGQAFTVSGQLGTLTGLVNASRVEHELNVTLGDATFASRGTISNLATLSGVDLEAAAAIPDPDAVTELFGMGATHAGPLSLKVTTVSDGALTSFTADATARALTAHATGRVDSLTALGDLDVELEASGPDVRPIAVLAGISDPSADAFEISGRVRWRGFPVEVTSLEARVGDNRLTADGSVGAPPGMLGTDFQLHGSGPNIAALGVLVGLELPAVPFEIDGGLRRLEGGVELSAFEVEVGQSRLSAAGFLGDLPEYAGTDLALSASGPDLHPFAAVAGVELPSGPFQATGRLTDSGEAIGLDGVRAHAGGISVAVDGRLTTEPGLVGSDLELVVDGDDLATLGPTLGLRGLPNGPFHVTGGLRFEDAGIRVRGAEARFPDLELAGDGLLSRDSLRVGSQVRGEVRGRSLAALGPALAVPSLPAEPFRVAGGLEVVTGGLALRGLDLELGSARGRLEGTIGTEPGLDGTAVAVEASGPSMAALGPEVAGFALPPRPFTLRADVEVADGEVRLSQGSLDLGGNRASLSGTIVPGEGLTGTAVELSIGGPDFGEAARLAATSLGRDWPELPALEYSFSTSLAVDPLGYRLEPLTGTLGRAHAEITGRVGRWPALTGTDLELDIDGPDASILRSVAGEDLPFAPFRVAGRLRTSDEGYSFDGFRLSLGDSHLELDGTVGPLPRLIGTDLDALLDSPNLSHIGDLVGIGGLPTLPVHLSGRFQGNPQRFKATGVRATLGSSDLDGSLQVDLESRPTATCTLRSTSIDAAELRSSRSPTGGESTPKKTERRTLIPDEPLDLSALEAFDLELDWTLDTLRTPINTYSDVRINLGVTDGRLELGRLEGRGVRGGVLAVAASIGPDPAGYRLETHIELDDGMANLVGPGTDPSLFTPLDIDLDLRATGHSPHELAARSDGTITVVASEGVVARSVVDLVAADIVIKLLETLNPFAKNEATTRLQCAVMMATLDSGVMQLDPVAIQTDRATVLGNGTIDLGTESIKLDWVTKPRKGFGISASAITNSYIRVGGTLAHPSLEAKPVEALATTGIAVATAGISILAKGLFDRVTAENKVCESALKEIAAKRAKRGR